jgi:hypothetical protein
MLAYLIFYIVRIKFAALLPRCLKFYLYILRWEINIDCNIAIFIMLTTKQILFVIFLLDKLVVSKLYHSTNYGFFYFLKLKKLAIYMNSRQNCAEHELFSNLYLNMRQ